MRGTTHEKANKPTVRTPKLRLPSRTREGTTKQTSIVRKPRSTSKHTQQLGSGKKLVRATELQTCSLFDNLGSHQDRGSVNTVTATNSSLLVAYGSSKRLIRALSVFALLPPWTLEQMDLLARGVVLECDLLPRREIVGMLGDLLLLHGDRSQGFIDLVGSMATVYAEIGRLLAEFPVSFLVGMFIRQLPWRDGVTDWRRYLWGAVHAEYARWSATLTVQEAHRFGDEENERVGALAGLMEEGSVGACVFGGHGICPGVASDLPRSSGRDLGSQPRLGVPGSNPAVSYAHGDVLAGDVGVDAR